MTGRGVEPLRGKDDDHPQYLLDGKTGKVSKIGTLPPEPTEEMVEAAAEVLYVQTPHEMQQAASTRVHDGFHAYVPWGNLHPDSHARQQQLRKARKALAASFAVASVGGSK